MRRSAGSTSSELAGWSPSTGPTTASTAAATPRWRTSQGSARASGSSGSGLTTASAGRPGWGAKPARRPSASSSAKASSSGPANWRGWVVRRRRSSSESSRSSASSDSGKDAVSSQSGAGSDSRLAASSLGMAMGFLRAGSLRQPVRAARNLAWDSHQSGLPTARPGCTHLRQHRQAAIASDGRQKPCCSGPTELRCRPFRCARQRRAGGATSCGLIEASGAGAPGSRSAVGR